MDEPQTNRATSHFLSAVVRRLHALMHGVADVLPLGQGQPPRSGDTSAGNQTLLAGFDRYSRAYFQRWLVLGALIGIVSGVGAIAFASAIAFCTNVLLSGIAGFTPPVPAGEGTTAITAIGRRWLIPVVTTLGGLLTGLIVYTLAPEAEGHGTDAAIEAFHEKGGHIRSRIPLVKLVASAITIGSGGSAGREGPTAQISAGFGSWLGDLLHLDEHDRRIAVAAGIGSGIGAIFKAPFGGAVLSAEVLYKRDFEVDALFPSFIASAVGFAIYGAWAGWTPVFGPGADYQFTRVSSLLGYLILGVCAGLTGILYPKVLYGVRDLFRRIHIPNHVKPAIAGLLVGLIGLLFPQALGMGYGYVQFSINSDFVHITAWVMAIMVFVKIVTTSLTIGSGGSGGVFGPGMVIGGFLGGALWAGMHAVAPWLVTGTNAGAFAVVGMGALFGGVAKAPLAVILMVAEMTGEYALITPAMLATMVAYLITGEISIYENQVQTRLDSPAHRNDYALPLLQSLTVREAMISGITGALATATPDTPVDVLSKLFRERHVASIPIIDQGRLVGLVTATDLARVEPATAEVSRARQVMSRLVIRAFPDESLYQAWLRMSRRGLRQLAVVDREDPERLLGMVTASTIAQVLRPSVRTMVRAGDGGGEPQVAAAPLAARQLAEGIAQRVAVESADGLSAEERATSTHATTGATQVGDDEEDEDEALHNIDKPDRGVRRPAAAGTAHGEAQGKLAGSGERPNVQHGDGQSTQAPPNQPADPLLLMHVADAMMKTPPLVSETQPLTAARQLLQESGTALLVVNDQQQLVGIVTRSDLRGLADRDSGQELSVGTVAVRNLVTAQPGETLRVAVRRMNRLGLRQLPVVRRGDQTTQPLGLLRRSDILAAYEEALGINSASPENSIGAQATT